MALSNEQKAVFLERLAKVYPPRTPKSFTTSLKKEHVSDVSLNQKLHASIAFGTWEEIRELLDIGADTNMTQNGLDPIQFALVHGRKDIANKLCAYLYPDAKKETTKKGPRSKK